MYSPDAPFAPTHIPNGVPFKAEESGPIITPPVVLPRKLTEIQHAADA